MDVCLRKKSQMYIPNWKHKSICIAILRSKNLEILQRRTWILVCSTVRYCETLKTNEAWLQATAWLTLPSIMTEIRSCMVFFITIQYNVMNVRTLWGCFKSDGGYKMWKSWPDLLGEERNEPWKLQNRRAGKLLAGSCSLWHHKHPYRRQCSPPTDCDERVLWKEA